MASRPDEVRVLRTFVGRMEAELAANSHKGDRPGWLDWTPEEALSEVHHHVAKLHVATVELMRRERGEDPRPLPWEGDPATWVGEYAADTANCCMQLLDVMATSMEERKMPEDRIVGERDSEDADLLHPSVLPGGQLSPEAITDFLASGGTIISRPARS